MYFNIPCRLSNNTRWIASCCYKHSRLTNYKPLNPPNNARVTQQIPHRRETKSDTGLIAMSQLDCVTRKIGRGMTNSDQQLDVSAIQSGHKH
jgi:hypothetical protein